VIDVQITKKTVLKKYIVSTSIKKPNKIVLSWFIQT